MRTKRHGARSVPGGQARQSAADKKWQEFLACPILRDYIIAFCSVEGARASTIVEALNADGVTTMLDHYQGIGTQIQCVSTLMNRMTQQNIGLYVTRVSTGPHVSIVYTAFTECPKGSGEPCKAGGVAGRRDCCDKCHRPMPVPT